MNIYENCDGTNEFDIRVTVSVPTEDWSTWSESEWDLVTPLRGEDPERAVCIFADDLMDQFVSGYYEWSDYLCPVVVMNHRGAMYDVRVTVRPIGV
jgi:hypothetical protein